MNTVLEVKLLRVLDKFERLLDELLALTEEKKKAGATQDG